LKLKNQLFSFFLFLLIFETYHLFSFLYFFLSISISIMLSLIGWIIFTFELSSRCCKMNKDLSSLVQCFFHLNFQAVNAFRAQKMKIKKNCWKTLLLALLPTFLWLHFVVWFCEKRLILQYINYLNVTLQFKTVQLLMVKHFCYLKFEEKEKNNGENFFLFFYFLIIYDTLILLSFKLYPLVGTCILIIMVNFEVESRYYFGEILFAASFLAVYCKNYMEINVFIFHQ